MNKNQDHAPSTLFREEQVWYRRKENACYGENKWQTASWVGSHRFLSRIRFLAEPEMEAYILNVGYAPKNSIFIQLKMMSIHETCMKRLRPVFVYLTSVYFQHNMEVLQHCFQNICAQFDNTTFQLSSTFNSVSWLIGTLVRLVSVRKEWKCVPLQCLICCFFSFAHANTWPSMHIIRWRLHNLGKMLAPISLDFGVLHLSVMTMFRLSVFKVPWRSGLCLCSSSLISNSLMEPNKKSGYYSLPPATS